MGMSPDNATKLVTAARRSPRPGQRLSRWLPSILILAALALPDRAVAGVRRCATHALTARDLAGAHTAATRALKQLAPLDPAIGFYCRNPMDAWGNFESIRRTTTDGVLQWWAVSCRRETLAWTCDSPELQREFSLDVPMATHIVKAVVRLSSKSDLELARTLVPRALRLVATGVLGSHACAPVLPELPTTAAGLELADRLAAQSPLRLDVWDGNGIELDIGANAPVLLEFKPLRAPPDQQQVCMDDIVIVASPHNGQDTHRRYEARRDRA